METATSNDMCNDNQDPDYYMLFNADKSHQNIFEKNARTNTAKKISTIIEAEFLNEINNKKEEISKIYKELNKACKMLHYLRFAIITDFYNQENISINDAQALKQSRLHCTVNAPRRNVPTSDTVHANNCLQESDGDSKRKRKIKQEFYEPKKKCLQHINPKNITEISPSVGANYKTKRRVIVGNISKWIPPDLRDNNASHKWTIYVRDGQKGDVGQFLSKVRFFLHPSYKPNDVVELTSAPFHLSRHGWGEFPARVQLHFVNSFDKPVDIIHHLKLDRTFTGLQTIGSETIVDLWISVKDAPSVTKVIEERDAPSVTKVIEERDAPSVTKVIEKRNQDAIFDHDKDEKSNSSQNCEVINFINDHDYICTKLHVVEHNTQHDSQNSIIITKESCLPNRFKNNENATQKSSENLKILSKIDNKQVLLTKESHMSTQHELLNKVNNNGNLLVNDKHTFEHTNDTLNLLNYLDIDERKIYLKNYSRASNEETSKALISLIEQAKPPTLLSMLKLVVRRMPLITEKSTDPYYKILHPYASESYQVFSNYSKGKQRSLERYRALSALKIIRNTKCYNDSCTVKEFITWARRYCYTPYLNLKNIHKLCTSSETVKLKDNSEKHRYSSTVSYELKKWLLECQKIKPSTINFDQENDGGIDIVNIPVSVSDSLLTNHNLKEKNTSLILMEYPKTHSSLNEFVCRSSQKIGIKLMNEEIIPGVSHSSASVLMTKAVECLIDELVRLAFSCALDKNKVEKNTILIESDDVRMALLKKEELKILTNAGLGSEG